MKKSNPSVYPITAGFEEQLKLMNIMSEHDGEIFWDLPLTPGPDLVPGFNKLQDVAKTMHEALGEYEHGTVEPEELISDEIRSLWNDQKKLVSDEDELFNIESAQRRQAAMTIRNVYIDLLLTMGSK